MINVTKLLSRALKKSTSTSNVLCIWSELKILTTRDHRILRTFKRNPKLIWRVQFVWLTAKVITQCCTESPRTTCPLQMGVIKLSQNVNTELPLYTALESKKGTDLSHRCCIQHRDNQIIRYTCIRVHCLITSQHTKYKHPCSKFLVQCPLTCHQQPHLPHHPHHHHHNHHHCCHHEHELMAHTPSSDKLSEKTFCDLFSFSLGQMNRFSVTLCFYGSSPFCFLSLPLFRISFFEQSLAFAFPSFLPALFSLGLVRESQSAVFLFIHYSVRTSSFSVNRATSKKLCTGQGLGLPSNVKSSLYVTFREGGREGHLSLYPEKVAESPLLVHFVAHSLQHLPFEDQDREYLLRKQLV